MSDEILKDLNRVIEKYKDKVFCTGELNYVDMAKSCKLEIERLNNIINELEKWCLSWKENDKYCYLASNDKDKCRYDIWEEVLNKLQELKEDGSNEPSFEEMVGFVENVYKDIKSQPTLHEELEEERKTIAKIVGDFKEVNK